MLSSWCAEILVMADSNEKQAQGSKRRVPFTNSNSYLRYVQKHREVNIMPKVTRLTFSGIASKERGTVCHCCVQQDLSGIVGHVQLEAVKETPHSRGGGGVPLGPWIRHKPHKNTCFKEEVLY